jgi:hypothetical protein
MLGGDGIDSSTLVPVVRCTWVSVPYRPGTPAYKL